MEYLDFELEIGLDEGGTYPVAVLRSPAGEARATMTFPFGELELENRIQALEIALLRSGSTRRRVHSPESQQVQAFGQALLEALLSGDVRTRYAVSQREAARDGKGLRLKLRIQPPELAALPWEFLYDPDEAEYVALSRETPVVRYLELPQTVQPLAITPPLQILGMVASPRDLPTLDVGREKQRIEMALSDALADGLVSLTWMEGQTWRSLQRAMRQGPWHVFHFIGHGGFDRTSDEGFIALADRHGDTRRFDATSLARMLNDHRWLRLVVLNACEGATGSQHDLFSSTAATLVRRGLPAVLAMQYEITDGAAIELARTFYEVLAEGTPVDEALSETRKAISFTAANTFEWGTPVLYMRAPDGVLFELTPAPEGGHRAVGGAPPPQAQASGEQPVADAASIGIPPDLYRRLQQTLARSEALATDRTLRALFVDNRLSPWRNQLPQADSVKSRVQLVVDFLYTRERKETGDNALVLLLQALRDRSDPADAIHGTLEELAEELAQQGGKTGKTDGERASMSSPLEETRPAETKATRGRSGVQREEDKERVLAFLVANDHERELKLFEEQIREDQWVWKGEIAALLYDKGGFKSEEFKAYQRLTGRA